ncbi:hemerythrin domain-containing protein [bacterium]|nr:MAG: hemerythrin domain-containing protein [bacterium]
MGRGHPPRALGRRGARAGHDGDGRVRQRRHRDGLVRRQHARRGPALLRLHGQGGRLAGPLHGLAVRRNGGGLAGRAAGRRRVKARRPPTAADLAQVRADHEAIAAHLKRHQEALVGFELSNALGELEEFARRLRRHIRLEEDILLPAYEALGAAPRGGKAEFFADEHRKIEAKVAELLASVRGLSSGSTPRSAVVALIEREARLKELLSHHEQREEMFMIRLLEKSLGGK